MKMKKCVLVCLFLIFLFPLSNALSANFYWAFMFSDHSKNINGETDYRMIATVGIDSDSAVVTLDLPDKGIQVELNPWGPYVWDPTYYEYGLVSWDPPAGDWYETSYQFLVDDGTSSSLFSHANNNIFPMDFVDAVISGGIHPTITWEPVEFADRYQIRFFDTVTGERLFEVQIYEDGSNLYSFQYLGNLFEEHEKLRIRISARDYDNNQIVNRSTVMYEHIANDSDGDNIPDDQDECLNEDSTGFDYDGDGCIDSLAGLNEMLETLVDQGIIDSKLKDSLLSKVANAEKSADKENIDAAINKLEALINEIDAQTGKKISAESAEEIVAYTESIIKWLMNWIT